MADRDRHVLGTIEASEAVLQDLYLDLRRSTRSWSSATRQTPQPRMGYVGQHLTSVVTGIRGGLTGGRGHDLVHEDGAYSEVKTCSKVDQLGSCNNCSSRVGSLEERCPLCESDNLERKFDSHWLLSPRTPVDLASSFGARSFYFVLFEPTDEERPRDVRVSIWEVNPRSRGFAYCQVDYLFNIGTAAPFNLWPQLWKFALMGGALIYRTIITHDDQIETAIFPGQRGAPIPIALAPLVEYGRATGLTREVLAAALSLLGEAPSPHLSKLELLALLETSREEIGEQVLKNLLAEAVYGPAIVPFRANLPVECREPFTF